MSIHGSSQMSSPGQFRPVLLPWVSKIDDKERCFLKYFGFRFDFFDIKCKKYLSSPTFFIKIAVHLVCIYRNGKQYRFHFVKFTGSIHKLQIDSCNSYYILLLTIDRIEILKLR